MSLSSYSDLQTALTAWFARNGSTDTTISDRATDFIALCEQRVNYGSADAQFPSDPLRIRPMEAQVQLVTGTQASGGTSTGSANAQAVTVSGITTPALGNTVVFTAGYTNDSAATLNVSASGAVAIKKGSALDALTGGEIIAGSSVTVYFDGTYWVLLPGTNGVPLPANWLAARRLYLAGSPPQNLVQYDPELAATMSVSSVPGKPMIYDISADAIEFTPPADGTYYVQCLYWKKFPALSASQTNNWLLLNAPGVYLNGSLLEAAIYIGDDASAIKFMRGYSAAVNSLQSQDVKDRYHKPIIRTDMAAV